MIRLLVTVLVVIASVVLVGPIALADAGHDDGRRGASDTPAASPSRFEADDGEYELVGIINGHDLLLYLDRFTTNEPVNGATVAVTVGDQRVVATSAGDGLYSLAPQWLEVPGAKDLMISVSDSGGESWLSAVLEIPEPARLEHATAEVDWRASLASPGAWLIGGALFLLGFVSALAVRRGVRRIAAATATGLLIAAALSPDSHAGEGHDQGGEAALVGDAAPRRLPDGSVLVPKPSQRLIGVRTTVVTTGSFARVQEMIGTVIPDPAASGKVQSTMAGRIEMPDSGIPHVGQAVRRGDVLAVIVPTVSVVERSAVQQQLAELGGSIRLAEQRVRRLRGLEGSVPQRDIDEAQAELDALRQRRAALSPTLGERETLRSPIAGVVAIAGVQAGQVVDAREVLFEIIDPSRLRVEAISFDLQSGLDIGTANAILGPEGHVPLTFVGRSPSLRDQTLPLLFAVQAEHPGLVIGRPVTVLVESREKATGIAVPRDAVVRGSNGLPQVFEHVSAERFRPVAVRAEPLDARQFLILAGLGPGQRVVTVGAELLNQIR